MRREGWILGCFRIAKFLLCNPSQNGNNKNIYLLQKKKKNSKPTENPKSTKHLIKQRVSFYKVKPVPTTHSRDSVSHREFPLSLVSGR